MELAMVFAALMMAVKLRTVFTLAPYALLSSLPYPCSTPAPLLSTDRFALLCIQPNAHRDSFFLAVSFFNPPGPPAWIANPTRPVSRSASLVLTDTFHLSLVDAGTSAVAPWSLVFPPSSPHPYALFLEVSGNLCVMDSSNTILWQSFLDHPLDLLLPQQLMTPGMQLISQSSTYTSLNITYSAVMEHGGLALFAKFSDSSSLPYSVFGLDPNSTRLEDVMHDGDSCVHTANLNGYSAVFFHDGRQFILQSCSANVSVSRSLAMGSDNKSVDFVRLDSDGSMRGYKYDYGNAMWSAIYDWFANSSSGVCGTPSVCGPYAICIHLASNQASTKCSCPSLPTNSGTDPHPFSLTNKSDSHQGCHLTHPFNCTLGGERAHYFLELHGVTYFANDALLSLHTSNKTKQQCVASCAENCSCNAAFYRTDNGACFLYEQVLSIIGLGNSSHFNASVFQMEHPTTNATQKISLFEQVLVHKPDAWQDQVFTSSDLMKLGAADVRTNYVGYLKVQNNSLQSVASLSKAGGRRRYLMITLGSTIAGFILLGATLSLLVYVFCEKRGRFKALGDEVLFAGQQSVIHFTFSQLQVASGDFKSKLGVGGFGSVYKGTLPNGSAVAIKQLESAIRGEKEFESQVLYLNSLNHPHLVRLGGLCTSGSHRFLVSEYMANGSLDAWIFHKPNNGLDKKGNSSSSLLDWVTRFKIALNVAEGLAFLHQANLVHLDVKPQNILLDENFVAKLSDYGLSRLMDQEEGSLIMHMRGTPGYMAPEWVQHAYATEKSDVYSYGMVLMEMLGGRKNVDLSKERENWYFPILAAKMLKEDKVLEVLDEKLTVMGEEECEQARRLLQLAFWCIAENPSKRPDMGSILSMLQAHQEVPEPPLPLHFDGHNVHNSVCPYDDDQQFCHAYYNQSGSSSPTTCFNISFVSEPSATLGMYTSWSSGGGGQLVDDCSLLLPSHD